MVPVILSQSERNSILSDEWRAEMKVDVIILIKVTVALTIIMIVTIIIITIIIITTIIITTITNWSLTSTISFVTSSSSSASAPNDKSLKSLEWK